MVWLMRLSRGWLLLSGPAPGMHRPAQGKKRAGVGPAWGGGGLGEAVASTELLLNDFHS